MSIYEEHRQKIAQRMSFALKETKELRDLKTIEYEATEEGYEILTFVFYGGGNFRADVTEESDLKMIQHIVQRVSALEGLK